MDVLIRKAREEELRVVQELNQDLFVHDGLYDPTLRMNWPFETDGEKYFKDRISGKEGVCFVAEFESQVVGYVAGVVEKTPSWRNIALSELENIFVKKEYRSKGIGRKLSAALLDWSREQGIERVKVSAFAGNAEAIEFYKKVGFIPYAAELEYKIE